MYVVCSVERWCEGGLYCVNHRPHIEQKPFLLRHFCFEGKSQMLNSVEARPNTASFPETHTEKQATQHECAQLAGRWGQMI
jgi:hypothetical protein